MRKFISTEAYANVNNAFVGFAEEHEVAGLKSASWDTYADTELGFSGAWQLDSCNAAIHFPGESGTVYATSVGSPILVRRAKPRLDRGAPCSGVYRPPRWISGRWNGSADRGWTTNWLDRSASGY